jgi:hypothetical protein
MAVSSQHFPALGWLARLLGVPAARRAVRETATNAPLVVCRACGTDFVYPVEWQETSGGRSWWVLLRCGGCDVRREVEIDDRQAADLGRRLDRHGETIERDARHLERERMHAEVDAFAEALRRDLIDAADFAVRVSPGQ